MYQSYALAGHDQHEMKAVEAIPEKSKILLIDDDYDFCMLAKTTAEAFEIPLDVLQSLEEVPLSALGGYKAIIMDYLLDDADGIEMARSIENEIQDEVPIILISGQRFWLRNTYHWPHSIKKFMPKEDGIRSILIAAFITSRRYQRYGRDV